MTVEELIGKWQGTAGGAETSNFQSFVTDLCEVMDIDRPGVAEKAKLGSYEYEASVPGGSFRSTKGTGAIDLYKRGHFIMEAKQSYLKPEQVPLDLDDDSLPKAPSGARYDKLMKEAWQQARNYARNLPSAEPVAPFLVVCDVGRAFELYVDPAGNGRDYEFFPDRQSYRIELADLVSDREVARTEKTPLDLLKAIWTKPKSVDPRFHAAEVTRKVARNLAEVSKYLEEGIRAKGLQEREKNIEIEESSLFLMRVLFCMFAEDIGLLPPKSFEEFLKEAEGNDDYFANGLRDLFEKMGQANPPNRFSMALKTEVRYFNGGLFDDSQTYPLGGFLIHNLYEAARQNWRRVEPAIFGTLLEQALEAKERAKLGAHYTPRHYVETLVRATIMDVLEPEWEAVEERIETLGGEQAIALACEFHDKLATTRVLDPACGTGNFLYVSMELLQSLESRVIERILTLGGEARPRVGPQQFYGLELNPRAAKIAELVLWIGWLRNRLKDDPEAVPEPVLKRSANLNMGRRGRYDAILQLTDLGEPDYENPVPADWPEAEFIVGNPPFIGKGEDMRTQLTHEYVEALRVGNEDVAGSADFVMQWWDRAAKILLDHKGMTTRFGFVSTNKISQRFNRRVLEKYLSSKGGDSEQKDSLSIVFAIPDHPWYKKSKEDRNNGRRKNKAKKDDPAAIRIAMTVVELGKHDGKLVEITAERALDTDKPELKSRTQIGRINPNLTVGTDVTSAIPLLSNYGISSNGMMLSGKGFKLDRKNYAYLKDSLDGDSLALVKPYIGGSELLHGRSGDHVIDLFGFSEASARKKHPILYQYLYQNVWEYEEFDKKTGKTEKKGRKYNRRPTLRDRWWIFAEPRKILRPTFEDIEFYIGTTETAKHRVFQFVETDLMPDHMIVAVGSDDPYVLGVLSSSVHLNWTCANCGLMGVAKFSATHRYTKTQCFDPFPFPDATDEQRATIAELAEELDETRKLAIDETHKLTMTELYNLREKLRSGEPLSDKESRRATTARAGIVDRLHEQLDQAVADAYGWGEEWVADELGPSEIVARLVALNHERAAEEAEGHIRWLRPDYQIPRFGKKQVDRG